MGSILGSCAGSCAAGLCCGACKGCNSQSGPISRLPYIFLFFIGGVFAIVMSLYGEKELNLGFYDATLCNTESCQGNGSVFRVSFCLFVFEIIHVLLIGMGLVKFHYLFFMIKFLLFVGGVTATFFIDDTNGNNFFNDFASNFGRYVSGFYLLIQILILILWSYDTNDALQAKAENYQSDDDPHGDRDEDEKASGCNPWLLFMLIFSACLYIISFILLGFFYSWYASNSGCGAHETVISISIVIVVLNGIFSAITGRGSFLVSAVVSFYITFLLFSALQADNSDNCNIWANERDTLSLWIGYLLTFLAIFYAALRADRLDIFSRDNDNDENESEQALLKDEEGNDIVQSKDSAVDIVEDVKVDINDSNYNDVDDDSSNKNKDGDNKDSLASKKERKSNTYFHIIMCLAACYFCMLFTSWGTSSDFGTQSDISFWVNMICQYVTTILFWWTLFAPIICKSRFANDDDDE